MKKDQGFVCLHSYGELPRVPCFTKNKGTKRKLKNFFNRHNKAQQFLNKYGIESFRLVYENIIKAK